MISKTRLRSRGDRKHTATVRDVRFGRSTEQDADSATGGSTLEESPPLPSSLPVGARFLGNCLSRGCDWRHERQTARGIYPAEVLLPLLSGSRHGSMLLSRWGISPRRGDNRIVARSSPPRARRDTTARILSPRTRTGKETRVAERSSRLAAVLELGRRRFEIQS